MMFVDKIPVNVLVYFTTDGRVYPRVVMVDGKKYPVTKIHYVRQKQLGINMAWEYCVSFDKHTRELYYSEEFQRWFTFKSREC